MYVMICEKRQLLSKEAAVFLRYGVERTPWMWHLSGQASSGEITRTPEDG